MEFSGCILERGKNVLFFEIREFIKYLLSVETGGKRI